MGLFSLGWFKSEKQKEKEALEAEEQELKVKILKRELALIPEEKSGFKTLEKPYRKIKLINNVLTIVLNDGNILSKPNATQDDFKRARNAVTEEKLFKIASSNEGLEEKKKHENEVKKAQLLINGIDTLKDLTDFEVEGNSVYLKGVKRSMPQLLVERFIEVVALAKSINLEIEKDVDYQSLKKFWLKCCLNPNAQSAEDLYKFLSKHQFKIDKHGNFYAYRRVVSTGGKNKELVEFVSNTYNKVKAVWKKNPSNFEIYSRLGDFKLIDITKGNIPTEDNPYWELIGNLKDLYLNLPNMQEKSYTSKHTGEEDYKVGSTISMPRNDGDDNNSVSCSKGFHAASKEYDYSGFGDTPILVIINPIDVLAVPHNEDGKLRTCRWFFASILSNEEQYILDDEQFDVTDLGDVFEEQCLMELQNYVQNSFAEEVKRHTFQLPKITATEITKIVHSLEEMKDILSKRVVEY